jgi:hypothetical protein
MFRSAFLVFLIGLPLLLSGQNQSILVPVEDLRSQWLTVDRTGEHYVPFIQGGALNYPVLGLILDQVEGAGLTFSVCVPEGTSVFINNTIIYRTDTAGCLYYDLDSLKSAYGNKSLFFSLFKKNLDPGSISTTLMSRRPASDLQGQTNKTIQITRRYKDQFADFFVVAILLVAAFYAFLINRYPKGNKDYFNFSKAFSLTLKEEKVLTQRNMGTANILFFCLYGMIIALVIILFWKVFDGIPELFEFISLSTFRSSLFGWLALSAIAFCVVELKYLLIKILSSLLNVGKIAQIHFFDFIRIGLIFVSTTLIAASAFYLSSIDRSMVFTVLLYIFVFLLGVRIMILLFKLIGEGSFRKIHLISYLCTTEILPLLIGIRIFF